MAPKKSQKNNSSRVGAFFKKTWRVIALRRRNFLERRPHRSFRKTYRRDIPKYAPLPGYVAFTSYVIGVVKKYRSAIATFLLLHVVIGTLLVGMASQENYQILNESFETLGKDVLGGDVDTVTQTLALFGAAATGMLGDPLSEVQQLYLVLLGLFSWLAVVWYLRQRMAGADVKVRDALYNSGAPFLSTFIVALLLAIQLVPGALGILLYTAADSAGILKGGVEAMIFATVALLLCILSLYWATSSFFAGLIVTIPGTYPMAAMKMAGDLVIGRRLLILLRLLWLGLALLVTWAVILIPTILISGQIAVDWLPLVPLTIQLLTAWSVLFSAVYIYLLYRRMIDEPAHE